MKRILRYIPALLATVFLLAGCVPAPGGVPTPARGTASEPTYVSDTATNSSAVAAAPAAVAAKPIDANQALQTQAQLAAHMSDNQKDQANGAVVAVTVLGMHFSGLQALFGIVVVLGLIYLLAQLIKGIQSGKFNRTENHYYPGTGPNQPPTGGPTP